MASEVTQRQRAEAVIGKHYECEDSWYSCPLSEEGCANDGEDKTRCNCGRDDRKVQLELLLTTARQEALREAVSIVEDWPLGIEDRLGLLDRLAREGVNE